jgi:succinoglycan biosynthesis transport protein ExoP
VLSAPVETIGVHPADILGSPAMRDLLVQASDAYDYIIVDLPAAPGHAEVRTFAAFASGIVAVVEWAHTTEADFNSFLNSLGSYRERICGVVLNRVAQPRWI